MFPADKHLNLGRHEIFLYVMVIFSIQFSSQGSEDYSMSVTVIVHLAPLTRSIQFRPYLATFNGEPILARMARHFLADSGAERCIVLAHYPAEQEALEQALTGTGAELRLSKNFSELQAVDEVLESIGSDQIALAQLGCALEPAGLLKRMVEHHCAHQNSFTLLDDAPMRGSLLVIESESLKNLLRISEPFGFSEAEDSLRRLMVLGSRAAGKIPVKMDTKPFLISTAYEVALDRLPSEVRLDLPAEGDLYAEAIRIANEQKAEADSPAVLLAIKQLQIERQQRTLVLSPANELTAQPRADKKKRVLVVSLPSAFSGAEQALCSMLRFLDRERFDLYATTVHHGVFEEKLHEAGAEVFCPEWETSSNSVEAFVYALELYRRIQPDLLHFNGIATVPFLSAAKVCGIPIVQHVRNGDMHGFYDGMVMAKGIIAITDFLKREALRFPIHTDHLRVIFDEVDTVRYDPALFDKQQCRRELGIDKDARVALMIARIASNKRYDLMLEAAARIRTEVPNFQLLLKGDVYGNSPLMNQLRAQAARLGIEDVIRWMDFVPDIRTLMAAADMQVLCSDREGLGSCVVEALSMALPVVVTNTGGTHEVVESNVSGGFVVPGSNAPALAACVTALLNDPALRERLGTAGRRFAQTKLDARITAKAVMEVYEEVLAEESH